MTVVPTESKVTVKPLAVATAGLSISTDQAPGELEVGGVKVIVRLSIVVTVASGLMEIIVKAAWAGLIAVADEKSADMARATITFILMGPL